MSKPTIMVNLNRCYGCWTCAVSCKVGNGLPDDTWRITVRTLGNGAGIDRPYGQWPKLKMSWMPVYGENCIMCAHRTKDGDAPFCTKNCPSKALIFGDLDDPASEASLALEELRKKGCQVFELPEWEKSRKGIVYAKR